LDDSDSSRRASLPRSGAGVGTGRHQAPR